MIVTLIAEQRLYSTSLPEKIGGQYYLQDVDAAGKSRAVANIEGTQQQWILHSSDVMELLDETNRVVPSVKLVSDDIQVIPVQYRASGVKARVFVEPSTVQRQEYQIFQISHHGIINIGRASDSQIVFENKYVSAHHARLVYDETGWSAIDTQSSNGTFVNELRIAATALYPGDVVYVMGMKVIIGNNFLALNSPDQAVTVNSTLLQPLLSKAKGNDEMQPLPKANPFYRAPRFGRIIVPAELKVDGPPPRQRVEEVPLALLLGPALTMGMTAVIMGAVSVINLLSGATTPMSAVPTIVMSGSMLCGTVLWPLLTKRNEKKRKQQAELVREEKYRAYLNEMENRVFAIATQQREIMSENYPDLRQCEDRILNRCSNLWERTPDQNDFLRLRLGIGDLPLQGKITFPERRYTAEEDCLLNDMNRLADAPKMLTQVPVTCSLRENSVTGIAGTFEERMPFLLGMILQLIALHSYDELKLIFLVDRDDYPSCEWVRWLPHVWDEDRTFRFLATDENEAKALSAQVEPILSERIEGLKHQGKFSGSHYILLAVSRELSEKTSLFHHVLCAPLDVGFSCICAFEQLRDLPKECSKAIHLENGNATVSNQRELSGKRMKFVPEGLDGSTFATTATVLANIELDTPTEQCAIPSMVTFLEMFGVGKVEHLNSLTRWKKNNPVNSLQAPVGIGRDGEKLFLDIHEKFQGPHGLIAGMTGSGKSEFIITYILSLAVNYHPDELAFILIDYKGGGLAGAFENTERGIRLPHLAGTITNLDGPEVKRSLISIQSELRRRQTIFNEARRAAGEGTIDIYKYQKMYRNGLVSEPVPHLLIISDEFAELKTQQPEFMQQLISAARIGRSLGVHLVLATQKPAGVVDDQIWSNSRFRICLKVQERNDSMDMLKRPDAAQLTETGRFYLQVGFDESFTLAQSAWCGAPYQPADRVERAADNRVVVVDHLGRVMAEAKPIQKRESIENERSQVVSIVDYLSHLAQEENAQARRLWLPPLPAVLNVDALQAKYDFVSSADVLTAIVGEYDDPFNQKQALLTLQWTALGNAVLYGAPGSGKAMLLNTVLYSLLNGYNATQLHTYLLDFGEEALQAFETAPQVGDVVFSGDTEKVTSLLRMLKREIKYRKGLLTEYGGDFQTYCHMNRQILPYILIVIHNYPAFYEQFETAEEQLLQIVREGLKYGIYFLITANTTSAIRYRVAQNFHQCLVLQLNDQTDYVGLLGSTGGVYPSHIKGRGIFKRDSGYEFQTARMADEYTQADIRKFAEMLAEKNEGTGAPPIPILPEFVDWMTVGMAPKLDAFPVGIDKETLLPCCLNLSQTVVTLLLAADEGDLPRPAQGLTEMLVRLPDMAVTVLDGNGFFDETTGVPYMNCHNDIPHMVELLFEDMVERNNGHKTAKATGMIPPSCTEKFYVMTGLLKILSCLSTEQQDKLKTLLEKATAEYGIRFLLCETAKDLASMTLMPWYKQHLSGKSGIWVGDGITDQYLLKLGKMTNELYGEMPEGFGYVVRRGKASQVKLVLNRKREESES